MNGTLSIPHGIGVHAVDYEEITVGAVAVGLTASKVNNSDLVEVRFENGPVRYLKHGSDPTAAVGMPAYDLDTETLHAAEALRFKAIRTGATNGVLRVTYLEWGVA